LLREAEDAHHVVGKAEVRIEDEVGEDSGRSGRRDEWHEDAGAVEPAESDLAIESDSEHDAGDDRGRNVQGGEEERVSDGSGDAGVVQHQLVVRPADVLRRRDQVRLLPADQERPPGRKDR
jgi:hypothetical protein